MIQKLRCPNTDFGVVVATENLDMGGAYLLYAKGNTTISTIGGSTAYITDQMMLTFRNTTGPDLQDLAVLQPKNGIYLH